MSDDEQVRLKVSEANQGDVGKGIVRIGEEFLEKIGARPLDVVEVVGSRPTAALAVSAYSAGSGHGHDQDGRPDQIQRRNEHRPVCRGQKGRLERGQARHPGPSHPRHADLCSRRRPHQGLQWPAGHKRGCHLHHQRAKAAHRLHWAGRPCSRRSSGAFWGPRPLAWERSSCRVISTSPAGIVKITEGTEIELLPQAVETPERLRAFSGLRGYRRPEAGNNQGQGDDRASPQASRALRPPGDRSAQRASSCTARRARERPCSPKPWPTRAMPTS